MGNKQTRPASETSNGDEDVEGDYPAPAGAAPLESGSTDVLVGRATRCVARRGSDSDRADTPAAARDEVVAAGASPCAGCPASCSKASTGAAAASGSARGSCALPRAALSTSCVRRCARHRRPSQTDRPRSGRSALAPSKGRRRQMGVLYCIVDYRLSRGAGCETEYPRARAKCEG